MMITMSISLIESREADSGNEPTKVSDLMKSRDDEIMPISFWR